MLASQKPNTHVKSFFAASVQAAIEQARLEMGSDALLLDSRDAPPEARHLGDFEVVFGSHSQPLPPAVPAIEAPAGLDDLRRQVQEIRALLVHTTASGSESSVAQPLIDAGVESDLAREMEKAARQRLVRTPGARNGDPRALLRELREEMAGRFEVAPEIGRVTALIGPPGAGKTTTIAKLAVTHGLAAGRPVHLISIDTQRIGGAAHLRTLAGILGVSFQAVETTIALQRAIDAAPANALVLIDTPGYSAALLRDLGGELAAYLSSRQDIDTHLVLTASMRLQDLYCAAHLYEPFRPSKLLFTRLDETSSLSSVFCVAARSGRPVSFLCAGQSIPEDIAPAAPQIIVDSLVRQLPSELEAAA